MAAKKEGQRIAPLPLIWPDARGRSGAVALPAPGAGWFRPREADQNSKPTLAYHSTGRL